MRVRPGSVAVRSVPRLLVVCLVGGAAAACSSETMRFADNPFQNPFSKSARLDPGATGSVGPARTQANVGARQAQSFQGVAPAGQVSSAPLPAPVASAPLAAPTLPAAPIRAASAAPAGLPATGGPKGWTAQGGSTVALGQGETITTLSNRYGVPEAAIRSANGVAPGARPAPGSQLVIPVYNAAGAAAPAPQHVASAPAPARIVAAAPPAPQAASAPQMAAAAPKAAPGKARMQLVQGAKAAHEKKVVEAQETEAPAAPVRAAAAKPERKVEVAKVEPKAVPKPEHAKVVAKAAAPAIAPKPAVVATAPAPAPAPMKQAAIKPAKPVEAPAAAPMKAAVGTPAVTQASVQAAAPAAAPAAKPEPAETASIAPAGRGGSEFRWPARGRIITGYNKSGGNDGINISLPEGTPVKAAEGGEVAYAGNELKGYGNLVLVRHPDGWVSAYAHNGELKVKRGDKIARGQLLALSGQSGNVSSPQLHFELRKGSTPVDPMPHLAGN
jgi:murein DD-endopeptidase MepM/ murein hydrolase activator NlpD